MWRFAIPLVVVAALVAVFWRGLFLDPGEVPSPLIGKPIPEFALPTLHDTDETFSSDDLKGHISLLNVFGTWCFGCHEEHALLMAWSQSPPYGIPVYGLNLRDERAAAIDWLERDGNPYTGIGFDKDGAVSIDWGVYGAPETFLIDAQGRVRLKHIGTMSEQVVREKILPAIQALRAEQERKALRAEEKS